MSNASSYEDIDDIQGGLQLNTLGSSIMMPDGCRESERAPLDARHRRNSMKFLVRQGSTVTTQKTTEGTMKLTYWF